jgi:hypothetical protein
MRNDREQELALECLGLASKDCNLRADDVVARAKAYFEFVTASTDQSPRAEQQSDKQETG